MNTRWFINTILLFAAVMGIWYASGFFYAVLGSQNIAGEMLVHLVRISLLTALVMFFFKAGISEALDKLGIKREGLVRGTLIITAAIIILAVAGTLVSGGGADFFLSFINYWFEGEAKPIYQHDASVLAWFLVYFVAVGFEEFVFRGLLLNYIMDNAECGDTVNAILAITIPSVLFGLYHVEMIMNLQFQVATILFGILAGAITIYFSRNTLPATILHLLSNTWVPLQLALSFFLM